VNRAVANQEISIEMVYERHSDGRYHVTSEDVPGFQMVGMDIDAIQNDLDEVIKDLLRYNSGFVVEQLRWVPSLEDIKHHLQKPNPEGKARYVASGTIAA
jgi:hypothetical protein